MLDLLSHMLSPESGCILFILYRYKGLFNDIYFAFGSDVYRDLFAKYFLEPGY